MADCRPGDFHGVEKLQAVDCTVTLEGGQERTVLLYGQPDALYAFRTTMRIDGRLVPPGTTGIPVFTDYETSRLSAESRQMRMQLAVGALVAHLRVIEPHPQIGYCGRVVDLSPLARDDDLLISLGEGHLLEARAYLEAAVRYLAALPVDERGVIQRRAMPRR